MTLAGLVTFSLIYLAFVISPGPGVAAVVARGLGAGLRNSAGYIAGFVLGDAIWFTIAATGLAALAHSFEQIFVVLKFLGCAYLLFLAFKIWRAPVTTAEVQARADIPSQWSGFLGTLTLTLSNPKPIVFFLSVMPLLVDIQHMTLPTYATILGVICICCGGPLFAYLFLATQARRVFRSERALTRINRSSAGLMAGAALAIGLKG